MIQNHKFYKENLNPTTPIHYAKLEYSLQSILYFTQFHEEIILKYMLFKESEVISRSKFPLNLERWRPAVRLSSLKFPHSKTHQILCSDRLPTAAGPHHHTGQSGFHVLQTVCQGQDGHDLTGHCDVEPCLENNRGKLYRI